MLKMKMTWTGSKTDLIELIYALYYAGFFNNGNTDIKEIAAYFEQVFNIELGKVYRTFLEIRARKNNRTNCLDTLKEILIRKMRDLDNNNRMEQ